MGHSSSQQKEKPVTGRRATKEKKKRHLSAACNFADVSTSSQKFNINLASVEDLMTLPGINRTLACAIVAYRNKIGGFRKVEDIALVTGVGAAKLHHIKSELFVDNIRGSVPILSDLSYLDQVQFTKVNVNSASLFELMSIDGISEEIAQGIIQFRTANKPFKLLEDLLYVNGIDDTLLSQVKSNLCVAPVRPVSAYVDLHSAGFQKKFPTFSFHSLQNVNLGILPMGPGQLPSVRPSVDAFSGSYNERKVLRIGSWNLSCLSTDKANNPGVREVVCLTLLENGIKLLAVQEVLNENALNKICLEMESPMICSIEDWAGDRGRWKYVILDELNEEANEETERVAFLWDSRSGLELISVVALEMKEGVNGKSLGSQPLLGHFKIGNLDLQLMNIQLNSAVKNGNKHANLRQLEALHPFMEDDKQMLVMGHFGIDPEQEDLWILKQHGFQPSIPSGTSTDVSNATQVQGRCQQNIWFNKQAQLSYTGRWGVIQQGLNSPWIPNGWSWGGAASHHCPIWAEFFLDDTKS
ncbi:endonuclease/exonuclease/phosphatase family domain-containing protein 1-like [Protopterus annectens]|uniref:endonuclease/exonuclease/phosphatase family domain-containing protein 1-like n=1 Tax=Protopterus annectens TaxID=7888 RepID=UPI001CFB5A97|nr:endonuclease/exonuclease/phosphatase family domain-containing protein 1-like [Protopterus annectens]